MANSYQVPYYHSDHIEGGIMIKWDFNDIEAIDKMKLSGLGANKGGYKIQQASFGKEEG